MKTSQSSPQLIYLACPYSHPDQAVRHERHMTANRVALALHKQGKFVYSPLTHNIPLIHTSQELSSWSFWGEFDQTMLKRCDSLLVIMIDGWDKSKGVSAEIKLAQDLGILIEMINPNDEPSQQTIPT